MEKREQLIELLNNCIVGESVSGTADKILFLFGVSTRFAIATETTDDIIKGRKYELVESESMGHYIIDESGEETYYHHSSLNVC